MESPTYRDVFSYRNISKTADDCTKGVTWKPSVQSFKINKLQWVASLHNDLMAMRYKSKGLFSFWIMERGKMRFIQSVHISERTVQKCLNKYGVKPVVEPRLIYDNGASREGKGTIFAIKRLRKHLATHYRKHRRKGGILIMDLHDYFNSILHGELLSKYKAMLEEPIYNLVEDFTVCYGDKGVGLGSEISQTSAILYPSELDHYIKERLHIKGYGRYMDDIYLIHEDIDYLKECLAIIEQKLSLIGLELNAKTKIVKFECGSFVFLKRRFFISESGKIVTRLLPKNITKRRRILKKQKAKLDKGEATMESIAQSYQSWRGYALKWDSLNTVDNMDKLYFQLFGEYAKE